jgi:drug/metabolite transporter (DMT)-like permease
MTDLLTRFRVDLLLLLVAASWGSTYLVAKELISPDSVVALLALRMVLAAAVMAIIVAARRNRVTAAELRVGVVLGVLLAVVFAFETFGIAHTSATNAGLIISLTMVFTPILESIVSGRRLPGRFFLAAIVAVVGVALLAGGGALRPPSLGDLLILVAAIVRAVHVTSMHKLSADKPMDSLHLTTVQLAVCAALFSATSLFHGDSIPHYFSQLDLADGMLFLYLVLACTVFAFFVQTWAVRRTSPSRVSLLLGTEPIWAAIIGITIAHDSVGLAGYVGIALILAGTAWGRSVEQQHRVATVATDATDRQQFDLEATPGPESVPPPPSRVSAP